MTWSYLEPSRADAVSRDEVRFLIGDTCKDDGLVQDEEIDWALTQFSDTRLASALVLRALAAKLTREVDMSVGGVSVSGSQKSTGFLTLASRYDPSGVTAGTALALPSFGGLSIAAKEVFNENSDAVQPFFTRTDDDIPGGPGDGDTENQS